MGLSWEMEGKPASKVYSQCLVALTLILGFFLVWIGTNATVYSADAVAACVPIYVNYRGFLVFVSALAIIVPSTAALDFAFAEGSKPVEIGQRITIVILDGSTFARLAESITWISAEPLFKFLETPWPLLTGWLLFGLCAFMPFGQRLNIQQVIACVLASLVGIVYAFRVLPVYWNGNLVEYKKWNYVYYGLMVFLFTTIGVHGQGALVSSMTGAILILLGQYLDMSEKKRGTSWIHQGEENRHEVSFGYGHPVYVVGWLLLCMAMTIPMTSS